MSTSTLRLLRRPKKIPLFSTIPTQRTHLRSSSLRAISPTPSVTWHFRIPTFSTQISSLTTTKTRTLSPSTLCFNVSSISASKTFSLLIHLITTIPHSTFISPHRSIYSSIWSPHSHSIILPIYSFFPTSKLYIHARLPSIKIFAVEFIMNRPYVH